MELKSGKVFAFSVFVFDVRTGELRRKGHPVPIPDQVARLLTVLVENHGQMVTREQLREQLWPGGEVLDYDHAINRTVSKLRAVLRERSGKEVDCIETLPKRGYRFNVAIRNLEPPLPTETPTLPPIAVPDPVALDTVPDPLSQPVPEAISEAAMPAEPPLRGHLFPTVRLRLALASVALIAVAAAAILGLRRMHRTVPEKSLTLGIVPFEASGDGAAALADSFRFDLADSLAEIPSIEVRAAHSFDDLGDHSGGGQDEAQIQARAQRLGISTILFGRFLVAGAQCQLQLELVRSRDGMHLMSLQYSGTREQLASIRDRIEHDVFERLHTAAGPNLAVNATHAASPKAYEAYLRGRSYLAQWTDDALHQAIQSFEEALAADPDYARADAGIASAYYVLAQHGSADRNEDLDRSRAYARRALAIDPSIAEAHAMLGEVALSKDWNFALAQTELNTATELDPSHAIYHQWLSILECVEGRYDLALQQIDRAHAADPDWAPPYMTEIYIADSAGQWDRADRAATVLLHKMPDWPLAHEQNAENLWNSGRYAAAVDEWHRAALLDRNQDRAALEERGARVLRDGGPQAYARLRLHAIQTRKGISYEEYDFVPAEWHAYAGEWEQALDDLEKLLESHSTLALQTGSNPAFLPLHKNPRFIALLTRFGVPFHPSSDR